MPIMVPIMILFCSLAAFAQHPDPEKEVLAAMNAWKQAMVARDRATLESLYDPTLTYTHSNGKQENKTEAIEAVVNGKDRIELLELTETAVNVYSTAAVVKTRLNMRTANGTAVNTLNLDVLFVWIKSPSGWKMAARHGLRLN
jgi:hypothetical protein